ncbi:MAG: hypothetical protein HKN27_06810 [Silicimonas sp.]|nr:hypothetical protein [Silicimonas sp.]
MDRAREERVKSISPKAAANDAPKPVKASSRTPSKLSQLPAIKSQEAFDPSIKVGLHPAFKLAIGALAFAAMAGFTLMDWRSTAPQTTVSAPAAVAPGSSVTRLPSADTPARVVGASKVAGGSIDALPAVPAAPSESPVVDVQQITTPLASPDIGQGSAPKAALVDP